MAATTLFFNGQLNARPGAYSQVDASALEVPSLGATGIVAIVGEAVGGKPYSAVANPVNDLQTGRSTAQAQKLFRSGDLRELSSPVLNPSNDDDIPSGAQQLIFVKTNPARQSGVTFGNIDGAAIDFLSKDYGLFTTQVQVTIADAAGAGAPAKDITVIFEAQTETFVDLGATAKFTLQYDGGADGATRATADAGTTSFEIDMERDDGGADSVVTTQATGGASIEILSDNAADTTQVVTVYGLDGSGVPQTQQATLSGTSPVAVPGTWNLETAVTLSAAAVGTVTVRNVAGAVVIFDVPPATLSEGRTVLDIPIEDSSTPAITVESDGASTRTVVYRGVGQNNLPIAEALVLTGTTPVTFAGLWKRVESVELANVESAQTLTLKGRMVNAPHASVPNLQKLKDKVNADSDFTLATLVGNPTQFLIEDLDIVSSVDVRSPATGSFFARLFDIISAINSTSQLITVVRANVPLVTVAGTTDGAYVVTVNGTDFTFNASSNTAEQIRDGLTALINAGSEPVTTTDSGTDAFTISADVPGVPFTVLISSPSSDLTLVFQEGTGAPDNGGPVFLAGGHEGDATPGNEGVLTSTATDVQAAVDLLKQVRVNTILVGSTDASVHAIVDAHCQFMGGAGRSERDFVAGAAAGETKTQLKARALALNSRHARLVGQEVELFNTAGERVFQPPPFLAAIVAGAQAGSPVGTPLTNKQVNILGFRQSSTWNPIDDADELILAGLLFVRDTPQGSKIERNVTTYLVDDNIAFTEASVNEAVNFATFTLRDNLQRAVGKKGFSGTVNGAKGLAEGSLNLLALPPSPVIVQSRNLQIVLNVDVLEVEVEISPVLPINFVPITVHLTTTSIAA